MPKDLDDNSLEDQNSSPGPVLDDDGVADMPGEGNSRDVETAASSPATGEKTDSEDSDYLSVVRDVVNDSDKKAASEDGSASPAEGEETGEHAGDDAPPKEQDDENFTDVPFHKHPRFQQLLRKSKAHEEDATRYRNVQAFIDQNGLVAEEAAELLMIGGLMKTNPAQAWQRMKPAIQNLLIAVGEVLPEDLKQRVQKGEISQEMALEYSRLRAQQNSSEVNRTFEKQRLEQQRNSDAQAAVTGAAVDWERDRRARDPNFDAKYERLMDQVYVLQRKEGIPDKPDGVKDQLNRAYKTVVTSGGTAPNTGQRQQTRQTNSSGQVAGNVRPAEQSTLDIIRANRAAQ